MQKKIVKNKKYFLFVAVIIIVGIVSGLIYSALLNDTVKSNLINTIKNQDSFTSNFILKDLIIMAVLLITSLFIIGIPLSIFYLFYEGLTMGFLLTTFFMSYKFKGIIYIIIYLITNKLVTFFLFLIFIKRIINIARYIIGFIIYHKDKMIKEKIINNIFRASYIIFFVFILNIVIYFLSPLLLKLVEFLIK